TNFAYNYNTPPNPNPYLLQHAGVNGPVPASFAIVKIGGSGPNSAGAVSFGNSNVSWITFIGFYYLYKGVVQGQTTPFMDNVTSSPNCFSLVLCWMDIELLCTTSDIM